MDPSFEPPLPARPLPVRPQTFRGVTVVPRSVQGPFRGGPIWPFYGVRRLARTCRGRLPWPLDRKPAAPAEIGATHPVGIWCGEADPHYGHMIADFGMRLAYGGHGDPAAPLVFATEPGQASAPPPFLRPLVEHFGIAWSRVLLVDRPVRFEVLHVYPQAERRDGRGPSPAHLAFLERITGERTGRMPDLDGVYVGRSNYKAGNIAGEAYLEQALRAAGVLVVDPETIALPEQIDLYSRARLLIFSDGSAVHTLQLVGRIGADVAVLVRRPFHRAAAASLRPRVRSLNYLRVLDRMIANPFYRRRAGRRDRGTAILHEASLLQAFLGLGIDLRPHWSPLAYRDARDQDLRHRLELDRICFGESDTLTRLRGRLQAIMSAEAVTGRDPGGWLRRIVLNQ